MDNPLMPKPLKPTPSNRPVRKPRRKYTPGEPVITDPAYVWEIYRARGATRFLADKYSKILGKKICTGDIARIKGGVAPYKEMIDKAKHETLLWMFRRQFGYDPIRNYTPPPFRDEKKTA